MNVKKQGSRLIIPIESAIILAKYKHFYVIDEYDGLESVRIDHRHYILHHVNLILQDTTLSNDDKIQRMNQLGIPFYLPKPEENIRVEVK
jgi:hypothetical protein